MEPERFTLGAGLRRIALVVGTTYLLVLGINGCEPPGTGSAPPDGYLD